MKSLKIKTEKREEKPEQKIVSCVYYLCGFRNIFRFFTCNIIIKQILTIEV